MTILMPIAFPSSPARSASQGFDYTISEPTELSPASDLLVGTIASLSQSKVFTRGFGCDSV